MLLVRVSRGQALAPELHNLSIQIRYLQKPMCPGVVDPLYEDVQEKGSLVRVNL